MASSSGDHYKIGPGEKVREVPFLYLTIKMPMEFI